MVRVFSEHFLAHISPGQRLDGRKGAERVGPFVVRLGVSWHLFGDFLSIGVKGGSSGFPIGAERVARTLVPEAAYFGR